MNYVESVVMTYFSQINKLPLLSREEEFEIAVKATKGDEKAKHKLILSNLRFVVQNAKYYSNCGIPLIDLISEGNLGLIRAVESFDPHKGFHFISYAVHWIKQSMIKAIADKSKIVRLPLNLNNQLSAIEKYMREKKITKLTDESLEDISKEIKMNKKDIVNLISVTRQHVSLDKMVDKNHNNGLMRDFIPENTSLLPYDNSAENSLKENLELGISLLNKNQSETLKQRFGLTGEAPKTLSEVGKKLGLSKERVRQIEKKALEKLKKLKAIRELKPYLHPKN